MPTVNYLRVIGCELDAANLNQSYRKDHRNSKTKLIKAYLFKPPKMTNITSTDVTFGGAWCNRVVAK